MQKKRSRLQIYLDVLRVIKRGVEKPTHIMYKCNLSWIPLRTILRSLKEQGLVVEEAESDLRSRYRTTQKGEEVLRYFSRAGEMITVEELRKKPKGRPAQGRILSET